MTIILHSMKLRTRPAIIIVALIILLIILGLNTLPASAPNAPQSAGSVTPQTTAPKTFNKQQYSTSDSASIWAIINKGRPLTDGYVPTDLVSTGNGQQLRSVAGTSMKSLVADASKAGVSLKIISGYRSQATQTALYNSYVQKDGVSAADRYSARPRHSEHQTGLSADLGNSNGSCDLDVCFGATPAGKWLASNAHKYGFVIRYQDGKESLTGYQYEPWHVRYVGTDLATEIQKNGQTLEQFFGLPASTSY